MKKHALLKQSLWLALGFAAVGSFLFVCVIIYFELQLPKVSELRDVHLQVPLRVFADNGKLIAEFGAKRRIPVTLKEIPQDIINATLSTEDKRYYSHPGVDIFGLARAALVLITTGKKEQGGSTITMQVARNYFLTRKKTYTRKIKEILLALKIDHVFSKGKVLELYFNKIFYGSHAYGIAAAAQVYYGKPLKKLTLAQSAMLAGLPQAPSYLNPLANPKAAIIRRNHVLYRVYDQKLISKKRYEAAIREPVTAKYHDLKIAVTAPYVAETVRQEMLTEYGKKALSIGLNVYTSINPALQKDANIAVRKGVLAYDKRHGYRGPMGNLGQTLPDNLSLWQKDLANIPNLNTLQAAAVIAVNDQAKTISALLKTGKIILIHWPAMKWTRSQFFRGQEEFLGTKPKTPSDIVKVGDIIRTNKVNRQWQFSQMPQVESALVAMRPQTGGVLALVGGFNYRDSQFNRAVQAHRQPGSGFKPFIYSAALAKGYTLASLINDAPVVLKSNNESGYWRPENDTRKFYGLTSIREGLIQSRNITSIRLLQLVGIPYAIDYATRFGFNASQLPHSLSLVLGTASVTPIQMSAAYSVFANGGYRVKPHIINRITNSQNQVVFQTKTPFVCDKICQKKLNLTQQDASITRPFAQRIITSQNAYLMTQAMKDVILYGTGRPALQLHRHDLAGKTGTTNNKVDTWFSGFNHHLEATVWLGFDKPRPLFEYATHSSLPIWINFMRLALKGKPSDNLPQPPNIVSVRIDPKNGMLAQPGQKGAIFEVFRQKFAPSRMESASDNSISHVETDSGDNLEQEIYN